MELQPKQKLSENSSELEEKLRGTKVEPRRANQIGLVVQIRLNRDKFGADEIKSETSRWI